MAGRAHLAVAWVRVGRSDRAMAVLSEDALSQVVTPTTSGRLTSQIRQEAVLLDALIELSPDHPWVPALVERLEAARHNGRWGSTLENAAAIAALSRYQASAGPEASFRGTARAAGQALARFDHQEPVVVKVPDDKEAVTIESAGTGYIYATITTQGLQAEASTESYDHQLRVRRRWLDRSGKPVDPDKLKVGDLVYVEVKIDTHRENRRRRVDNIAIVDALPGGLEVENPRLATSVRYEGGPECDTPDHTEFLDDRVVLFGSAWSKPRVYRYALRAITPGTFTMPPIQASCMYDEGLASIHGHGSVRVQP
jgi:uncharacterized protein YfaS (alpha-2-macroglobulin family)